MLACTISCVCAGFKGEPSGISSLTLAGTTLIVGTRTGEIRLLQQFSTLRATPSRAVTRLAPDAAPAVVEGHFDGEVRLTSCDSQCFLRMRKQHRMRLY